MTLRADKMDKADKTPKEAVSKVFLTQRHKDFSQSSQGINPSKRELCVPCVNPLRTLRLRFLSFEIASLK